MAHLPSLISQVQFEARTKIELAGAELIQFQAFAEDASADIRRVAGTDFMTEDEPPELDVPEDILPIAFRVINRAIENPLGLDSETFGDYTRRKELGGGSGVFLTKDDEDDIRDVVASDPSSGLVSVPLSSFPLPE